MKYRILSLDGGGIWSIFQVMALKKLYGDGTSGHTVLKDFNLVAANSGGSFVLGGLVENLTLAQLFDYFADKKKRKAVFSPNNSLLYWILQKIAGVGPKHSTAAKLKAIEDFIPNRGKDRLHNAVAGIQRIGSSEDVHLLIIGFDYDRKRAAFFRSAPVGKQRPLQRTKGQRQSAAWGTGVSTKFTLAQAIHASSNAPVNYFDLPAQFPKHEQRFWDGGVTGCNNPIVAAVTEALVMDKNPTDIAALTIGTGTVALLWPKDGETSPFYQTLIKRHLREDQQLRADIVKLAASILDDPPDIASFLAHVMTGGGDGVVAPADSRIVRFSPLVSPIKLAGQDDWKAPGNWRLDKFADLADLDIDAVEQEQFELLTEYAQLWLDDKALNQPIRKNGDTGEVELGFEKFSEAVEAWQTIK